MSKETNWKGIQATGCKKPDTFRAPKDVKTKYMSMGSWHADIMKDGVKRKKGG